MDEAPTGDRTGNLVAAAALVVVGLTVFWQTGELARLETGSDPGAAGYPRLLAAVLLVLAVGVGFQRGSGEPAPSRGGALRVGSAALLLVGYALLLEPLGYVVATAAFLVMVMLLLGIRWSWSLLVVPVAFGLGVYLVFSTAFGVPLPRGSVEGLLP